MLRIFPILLLLIPIAIFAQNGDYYNANHLRYDDHVYVQNIKTVQLYPQGNELGDPILNLNSESKLMLSFDDLNAAGKTYTYKMILCNYDWTPADLFPMEYIQGIEENYIDDVKLSYNTTKQYSHYTALIPSDDSKIIKSGNYLLKVYSDDSEDNLILTRRFYVNEQKISAKMQVARAQSPHYFYTHQEIMLELPSNQYPIVDVHSSLKIVLQQNCRKDNQVILTQPKAIKSQKLIYNINSNILFEGTNEFRKLDLRSLKIQSANMANIQYDTLGYHVYMLKDPRRNTGKYMYYQDINGKFSIINWDDPHRSENIEADYAMVHFSFPRVSPFDQGNLYIFGELSDWNIQKDFMLKYNPISHAYEASVMLKQGYYEYQYVLVNDQKKTSSTEDTEGNYSETENSYKAFIYHRDQGEDYDKLIGIKTFESKK